MLGIQTRGRRMVRADRSTELQRPPIEHYNLLYCLNRYSSFRILSKQISLKSSSILIIFYLLFICQLTTAKLNVQQGVDSSGATNPSDDDVIDTVVAKLVYDETRDELTAVDDVDNDDVDVHTKNKTDLPANPIFAAFKEATGVDDLYRIAEIWVNPPAYYTPF